LNDAASRLRAAGIDSPRADLRILRAHAKDDAELESFIARRLAHEPVAYIVGCKEFWSLEFAVGPGVLVPRPETETLIEEMLKSFPDRTAALDVLDLGTGTGCLLIAALGEYPNARGTGVDSSPEALAWARRNVDAHRVNAELIQADFAEIDGTYDVIL
jgi:release factor glutamine methyltransferase